MVRLSTINEYENGRMKMIDQESMIKSHRLVFLKRIFGAYEGAWKSYLQVSLEHFGSLFYFTITMMQKITCHFSILL